MVERRVRKKQYKGSHALSLSASRKIRHGSELAKSFARRSVYQCSTPVVIILKYWKLIHNKKHGEKEREREREREKLSFSG